MRQQLLQDRYFAPGETDEQQIYKRVATAIGRQDAALSSQLYDAMSTFKWLPNTPTLVNAGRGQSGGLSACYVLPIEDSLDGIYKTLWDAARVHKSFGGTGFNLSRIRGKGLPIKSTGGKACGPIKVMELLNQSADTVMQGGKREGANMGILNASHPDIHEFIRCKESDNKLSHFNISVGMTDQDMKDDELLTEMATQAWKTGDPGIIFLDRLNTGNMHLNGDNEIPVLPPIDCTNPCGEQPLRPYESCNLGSINLSKFPEMSKGTFTDFITTVKMSVEALDTIIDINTFPTQEISNATLLTRKIGSGVMGWADYLIMNGISYQSDEALIQIDHIADVYKETARRVSHERAQVLGNYPLWGRHPFAEMRNETLLTIAPTGTLSYLADCSWGIEPVFDWEYNRDSESGSQSMKSAVYTAAKDNDLLKDIAKSISAEWQIRHVARWQKYVDNGVSKTINLPSSATVEDVIQAFKLAHKLGCKGITVYRDGSKTKQVVTTTKLSGGETRSVQQPNHTDGEGTAPTEVQTVRLHTDKSQSARGTRQLSTDPRVQDGHNVERVGTTLDCATGCGRIHITCNERRGDNGIPFEVYILSDGGCPASNEALGKVISKYLHDPRLTGDERATAERIIKTLKKVDCATALRNPKSQGKSCAEILAKRMAQVWVRPSTTDGISGYNLNTGTPADVHPQTSSQICPQCGEPVDFGSGCRNGSCRRCGWSGCS